MDNDNADGEKSPVLEALSSLSQHATLSEENRLVELEESMERVSLRNSGHFEQKENETGGDVESSNRKNEPAKTRYLRLKQRLTAACYRHEEISFGKEATSQNKPRLLKLSLQLERQVGNQVHNYGQIETFVRDILKIIEQKKQNDLHILRQSKLIPSLMDFFKKLLSSHRNQYKEALKVLDPATKLLMLFCTVGTNRQYLLMTNRFQTISSLFSWALSKRDEIADQRIIVNLNAILCYLLEHRFEGETGRVLEFSIEFVFYSQLLKRVKATIEGCITEDGLSSEPLVRCLLRFLISLLMKADPVCQMKAVYEEPSQNVGCLSNLDWILCLCFQIMNTVLVDRDSGQYETVLSVGQVGILSQLIRLINICCILNLPGVQKWVSCDFLLRLRHVILTCNQFYGKNNDINELLNQTIILLGYVSLENPTNQQRINENKTLYEIVENLPTDFQINKTLVEILMPTLCCLIHNNQKNCNVVFKDMSTLHMKKFLKAQMQLYPSGGSAHHSRKLSLSSSNSAITQCSTINFSLQYSPYSLKMRFPRAQWSALYESLQKIQ